MSSVGTSHLRLEQEGPVATIVFDREQALNALTPAMIVEFGHMLELVDNSSDIRCLVLRGQGRSFMAGGDLAYLSKAQDPAVAADSTIRHLNIAVERLVALSKPTIASVHGVVAGAGLSLTLACDLALAADDTRFVYAYDAIAASPDGGLSYLLPRIAGLRAATAIAFLGEPFSAAEALANRMVTRIVPADTLRTETMAMAQRLSERNIEAMVRTRRLLHAGSQRGLREQLEDERHAFVACAATEAFRDAIEAFFAVRKAGAARADHKVSDRSI